MHTAYFVDGDGGQTDILSEPLAPRASDTLTVDMARRNLHHAPRSGSLEWFLNKHCLVGLVVKASASRSGAQIPLATGFFRVESYQ